MAKQDTKVTVVPDRTTVYLGNRKAVSMSDGERLSHPGKRCTTVIVRDDATLLEAVQEIASPQGLWSSHSDAPAPAWIAASGPLAAPLTQILAAQWPGIEVREPEWEV